MTISILIIWMQLVLQRQWKLHSNQVSLGVCIAKVNLRRMLTSVLCLVQGTAARSGDPAVDLAKARALGNALVAFLIIPWTLSSIIYTGAQAEHHPEPSLYTACCFVLGQS